MTNPEGRSASLLETMIRQMGWTRKFECVTAMWLVCLQASLLAAAPVTVRYKEGLVRGFLVLRNTQGEVLADGDWFQTVRGDVVKSRLVFHFKDGSVNEETAVFSQRGTFRLISDHLVQKGPSFKVPVDMKIDGRTGEVSVQYIEDGKEKKDSQHLKLPADCANGLLLTLLKDLGPGSEELKVGFVVATPKPRLVTLDIHPQGDEPFTTGEVRRSAMNYDMKVELGGITGALASLLGKDSPDLHVWILRGEAPAFVKFEGPLAPGNPVWRIELVNPTWPR